jgi:hypothetical protein
MLAIKPAEYGVLKTPLALHENPLQLSKEGCLVHIVTKIHCGANVLGGEGGGGERAC